MLPICGKCHGAIKTRPSTNNLTCSGTCGKQFHSKCVDIPDSLLPDIASVPGLHWKCAECEKKCFCLDSDSLNAFLAQKLDEMINNLKDTFTELKTDLVQSAERQIKDASHDPKPVTPFSVILKSKTKPAIIVEPKNREQNFVQTKTDVTSRIDPVDAKIQIQRVKSIKNGGMLIGCSSSDQNSRFKQLAQEKLSESYVIREVKGVSPRVKVVGFTELYQEDELNDLADRIMVVNNTIFNPESTCRILRFWPTKKKPSVYQALLQVDKISYDRLMAAGGLFADYDYCNAFEGLEVNRCFNCNNFGHSSRVCKEKISCPKCSCEHRIADCQSDSFKCINCTRLVSKENKQIDTQHAVWDHNCTVYQAALSKLKTDIFSA
ncbi:hypothetical protein Zmor_007568 [Zophobas morio]|uniref:PHD-type domain-containing protein n=1 Tax=Zophobas morio TaxID=2755281 RepID=A0AA38IVR7_9CUCU|nr:hypothetical protein Zmor_007568 [Zophobas morio]